MTPKERAEKPWLEPSQMALARRVLENSRLAYLKRCDKTRRKPSRKPVVSNHCARGHLRTSENTRVYQYGTTTVRQCIRCVEIRKALRKEQQRALERDALQVLRKYGIPATARPLKTGAAA